MTIENMAKRSFGQWATDFIKANIYEVVMVCVLVLLIIGFSLVQPLMLSLNNLKNVLSQACYLMIFSSAQTVVLLTRGFDLSLGTTVSLVSVAVAMVMTSVGTAPVLTGIAAGLGIGLIIGFLNGFCVAVLKINPFVVTLGMYNILLTISSTISNGFPITNLPKHFSALLSDGKIAGIPMVIIVVVVFLILLELMLRYTVFGRCLYLIGSNPKAAKVAGVPIKKKLIWAYMLCSFLIAAGAILLTARTGSGEPGLGGNLTLQTVAAAVIGGISLQGGSGNMLAPIFGALLVMILSNGMNLVHIDGYIQEISLGLLIICAICLDRVRTYRR